MTGLLVMTDQSLEMTDQAAGDFAQFGDKKDTLKKVPLVSFECTLSHKK